MYFLSKLINLFVGYFDPIIKKMIIKINNFRGDLRDISAETATLLPAVWGWSMRWGPVFMGVYKAADDPSLVQSKPVLLYPELNKIFVRIL